MSQIPVGKETYDMHGVRSTQMPHIGYGWIQAQNTECASWCIII